MPIDLLCIESGLSRRSVEGLKKDGFRGSEIVDAGNLMRERGTNMFSVKRLKEAGIGQEYWEGLIDMCKSFKLTLAYALRRIDELGGDADEFLFFGEELEDDIENVARKKHRAIYKAFNTVFFTYLGDGMRDVEITSRILENKHKFYNPSGVDDTPEDSE